VSAAWGLPIESVAGIVALSLATGCITAVKEVSSNPTMMRVMNTIANLESAEAIVISSS